MAIARNTNGEQVKPLEGSVVRRFTPGGAIAAGQLVSMKATGKILPSDATAAKDPVLGVAIEAGGYALPVFQDAKQELREHGHQPPYNWIAAPTDETVIRGVTGFVPAPNLMVNYGATMTATAGLTVEGSSFDAAEQMYRNGTLLSIDRFEWVQAQVHAKWPNLSEQDIEVFIESSVVQLKGALVWLDADV